MKFLKTEQGEYISVDVITHFKIDQYTKFDKSDTTYKYPFYNWGVEACIKNVCFKLLSYETQEEAQKALDALMEGLQND